MPATGADLPSELLSHVIYHLRPMITDATAFEDDRYARQGLAACSLVCHHWSNVISPMLFEFITLRGPEDIRFLLKVIDKATGSRPFLLSSIQTVWLHEGVEDVSRSQPWLHHAHSLSARLPKVSFTYSVFGKQDDNGVVVNPSNLNHSAVQAPVYSPFRSLPRLPPSSALRLNYLSLGWLQFASKTELARFIDSFPTLKSCQCGQLTFVDPSPIIQSRRLQRRPSAFIEWDVVWRCDGTALTAQAALASDIIMASSYLGLDGDEWSIILQALVALAPGSFDGTSVRLGSTDRLTWVSVRFAQGSSYTLGDDAVFAIAYARWPDVTATHRQPQHASVERLVLFFSFASEDAVESIKFDALRAIVDSPQFCKLVFQSDDGSKSSNEYKTLKTILRSVLDRKQLTWALDSRKLQFQTGWKGDIVPSSDIISVPTEHILGDVTITLDTSQQAEWLLCFTPNERMRYLRDLVGETTDIEATTDPEEA